MPKSDVFIEVRICICDWPWIFVGSSLSSYQKIRQPRTMKTSYSISKENYPITFYMAKVTGFVLWCARKTCAVNSSLNLIIHGALHFTSLWSEKIHSRLRPYIIAAYFEQTIELAIEESSENIFLDKYFRKPMIVLIRSQIIDFKCSARRLSFSYLKLK